MTETLQRLMISYRANEFSRICGKGTPWQKFRFLRDKRSSRLNLGLHNSAGVLSDLRRVNRAIGLKCSSTTRNRQAPLPHELGPGRGTLMSDIPRFLLKFESIEKLLELIFKRCILFYDKCKKTFGKSKNPLAQWTFHFIRWIMVFGR